MQGIGNSEIPAISADGRFVAFRSTDPYLVPDDSNAQTDIFVHDRQRGKTTRVSVSSSGKQANGFSVIYPGGISGDGRVVAFPSTASNLVHGDTNSDYSAISADGRFVAFERFADNLVPGDISGWDIFVRDRLLVPDQTADLVVRQTASTDPVGNGEELTYTVTVHNQGPDPADHVSLIDLVPHNAHLLSVSPSQGSCSQAPVSVCHLGSLAAGESATVEVRLTATHTGVLRNTAFGTAAPNDPTARNNSRTMATTVE